MTIANCPKCKGTVVVTVDRNGKEWRCLHCGWWRVEMWQGSDRYQLGGVEQ
jgi:DNA-directed RNA polymerase subunit RPC12/RpoP